MRRGFKREAEEYASDFRTELGLAPYDPLCPFDLAAHLMIPVVSLSSLEDLEEKHKEHLANKDSKCFSAVTVFNGRKRLIVHNDYHHPRRQRANVAHELAHGILGHPSSPPLNDLGCRNFNKEIEDEANWLGPTLLVPRPAALHIVDTKMETEAAVESYGVSRSLLTYRINATGVKKQLAFRHKRKAS